MGDEPREYEYDINQCSVSNKALLQEFRDKRTTWLDWFERDSDHNICDQIYAMMWDDAAYRSFSEARRFASKDTPTAAVNGLFGELIDHGYVAAQILCVCKLVDRSHDNPKKGVISLRRLSDDIHANRHLITRENYVSFDGLPYDYAAVQKDQLKRLRPGIIRWGANKGPEAWAASQRLHDAFDKLSGVAPDRRNPTDLIDDRVFRTITSWFDEPILDTFSTFRNKHIGHAADKISRQIKPLNRLGLSLVEIENAQQIVIRIATTVGSKLLQSALGGVVPTAQFDVYEFLDAPVIPAANKEEMTMWWSNHERDRERWLQQDIDLITGHPLPKH